MEKTINSFELRRSFGKILQDVSTKGDKFIVERHGMPVAVLVPLTVYEQWKQSRERFFAALHAAQEKADLPEKEAMALAQEAVQAVRARKRV
ncbi:hypothetical protein BH24BAC1_BH24BAC1_36820 [soil metagenome]